jgi:chorismate mutase
MQNENLISLLSETLKFYSSEKNYDEKLIEQDRGMQARFVLDLAKRNQEQIQKFEEEYEKYLLDPNYNHETLNKIIEDYKNLK